MIDAREHTIDVERAVGVARDERRARCRIDALVGQGGELLERGGPDQLSGRRGKLIR